MEAKWIRHVMKLHEQNYGNHHTDMARKELTALEAKLELALQSLEALKKCGLFHAMDTIKQIEEIKP